VSHEHIEEENWTAVLGQRQWSSMRQISGCVTSAVPLVEYLYEANLLAYSASMFGLQRVVPQDGEIIEQ
jgi:hypothetical protein